MRRARRAAARRQPAREDALDPERFEGGERADHVHDRIDAADLVEVRVLALGDAVYGALRFAEQFEGRDGALADACRQRRRLDHRDDPARGPRGLRRLDAHVRLRRREARAAHGRGVERPALDRQGAQRLAHGLEVRARVEGGAEQHVAGGAEARIYVGDPHRCPPAIRRRRPAARTTPAR